MDYGADGPGRRGGGGGVLSSDYSNPAGAGGGREFSPSVRSVEILQRFCWDTPCGVVAGFDDPNMNRCMRSVIGGKHVSVNEV